MRRLSSGMRRTGAMRLSYESPVYKTSSGSLPGSSLSLVVMLPERIDAVAPNMPPDVRRCFLSRDYAKPSVHDQDWDLSLAEWSYMPLLIEYTEHESNLQDKRFVAFSALMVLQGFRSSGLEEERRRQLSREIERIVLQNQQFAREVSDEWLGLIEALTVKRMRGDEIPEDIPKWIREEVQHRDVFQG